MSGEGPGGGTEGAVDQGQGAREADDASKRSPAGGTHGPSDRQITSSWLAPGTPGLSTKTGAHPGGRVVATHLCGDSKAACSVGSPLAQKGPKSAGVARWARQGPRRSPRPLGVTSDHRLWWRLGAIKGGKKMRGCVWRGVSGGDGREVGWEQLDLESWGSGEGLTPSPTPGVFHQQ